MTLLEARSKLRWAVTLASGRLLRNVTVCCGASRAGQSFYCVGCLADAEVLAQLEAVLIETETVGPEQLALFETAAPEVALDDGSGGGVALGG